MNRFICAGALAIGCAAQASPAPSANAELSGLVELGSVRLACVKFGAGGEGLVLHPGETAGGITLKEMHVKEGWALFEEGTNQFRLRLVSYCADAAQAGGTTGSSRMPGSHPEETLAAVSSLEVQDPVGWKAPAQLAAQKGSNPVPPAWMLPYLPPEQVPVSTHHDPPAPAPVAQDSSAPPPAGVPSPDSAGPQPTELTQTSTDSGTQVVGAGSGLAVAGHHPNQNGDVMSAEEQQLLMYGGRAAYLAWDIQQWRNGQSVAGASTPPSN